MMKGVFPARREALSPVSRYSIDSKQKTTFCKSSVECDDDRSICIVKILIGFVYSFFVSDH
ncbi:hypothetical protein CKO_04865 [Citrobacter koseri ATCC BAA-895]|uniref:Uncharacterized protein n=1 Tax=Citrobacter koseri (strain ATCC BAA-895 / CDC 4225-83 / SGSC4696) TaxID=290338 RepID=A8AQZ5_CITK8|nr:hypothetical protein CKO_04865 [Citrobacter koseri ATCC BAA-895]